VFDVGSIPESSYNVVKDQNYCGEVKVALTFNPEVKLSVILKASLTAVLINMVKFCWRFSRY